MRERLLADFVRFCEIESPSGSERPMADAVLAELHELGLEPEEDDTGAVTGSDAGNVFARLPGRSERTILLCAHMDTVPLGGPVEVVEDEGVLRNRHDAVLGADNKAAVATILGAVRQLVERGSPAGVELLFTTHEEDGLLGAHAFDRSRLRAEMGFVFDHATPIGDVILAAPTYQRVEARFRGVAAHAGLRPEDGRSAIEAAGRFIDRLPLGRLDDETTANAGRIEGGGATNVVPASCLVELEARSIDHDRLAEVVTGMVDTATEAASDLDCDVETTVEELFRGFRLRRTSPPVELASAALEAVGIEARPVVTGGGSDANALIAAGLPTANVANGTERNHRPDESVTVQALEQMLDVTLAIVEEAGR
ncbi:MAG TPA: M20/M25/M40 family metallo-hydrolase [Thermoleophilaceae bacterium]|nr:M20/M25/M40 family metallo-hydrolase [Thermoleophilaceae bacterium]